MRTWLLRLAAIALLLGLPPAVRPAPTSACSCPENYPLSIEEEWEGSRAVFAGRVVSHRVYNEETTPVLITELRVTTVWKGPRYETIYLTDSPNTTCESWFAEDEEYLVYVSYGWTAPGLCGRKIWFPSAQDDLAVLGEGQSPQPGSSNRIPSALQAYLLRDDTPPVPVWGIGLLAAVSVVAVVGGWYWLTHRRSRWDPRP